MGIQRNLDAGETSHPETAMGVLTNNTAARGHDCQLSSVGRLELDSFREEHKAYWLCRSNRREEVTGGRQRLMLHRLQTANRNIYKVFYATCCNNTWSHTRGYDRGSCS